MRHLIFDVSDGDNGSCVLEAVASTQAAAHPDVMAEVQQVLDWAEQQVPGAHGPLEDGFVWDHALLVHVEAGGWVTVSLTLAVTAQAAPEFAARLGHDALA